MLILISAICVWLLGSAFGFGWSIGSLKERGMSMSGNLHHSIWAAWPAYLLGKKLGQMHTARQLAPERMKAKLQQEMWQQSATVTTTHNPWQSVTWSGPTFIGGSGGSGGASGSTP